MDDEICPYATFHLLGFREEMDPSKAMQFQTFPHPHAGTMGPSGMNTPHQMHSRSGSQSMPRQNRRYDRVGSQGKKIVVCMQKQPLKQLLFCFFFLFSILFYVIYIYFKCKSILPLKLRNTFANYILTVV